MQIEASRRKHEHISVSCGFRRTMTSMRYNGFSPDRDFHRAGIGAGHSELDPGLEQLVGPDSRLERIATGFNKWTEASLDAPRNSSVCGDPSKTTSTFGFRGRARAFSCTLADIQVQSHSMGRSQAQME